MATLDHPTLGCKITGKSFDKTVQFRNLKFASIPRRWQDPILLNRLPSTSSPYDATQFGPSCPHKRGAWKWDCGLVGDVLVRRNEVDGYGEGQEEWMDEFECLNAVVTVPRGVVEEGVVGLGVLVQIHGGGLAIGSNSWPQYDLEKLVARSVEIGKPVIGVSINYRLGVFGFLASTEAGISGNFGYKDQALGFHWIKKHIAGFGGDPNNVTAMGESGGAISITTLLHTHVPLFTRAITTSGDPTLRKPRSMSWHDAMYADQLKLLNLEQLSVKERVEKFKAMNAEELSQRLPLAQHYCALVDGDFLQGDVTLGVMQQGKFGGWCKEVVVGDCASDGTILKGRILDNPTSLKELYILCGTHLSPTERDTFLAAYNLLPFNPTMRALPSPQQKASLLELCSDLRFHLPLLCMLSGFRAQSPPTPVGRFHFHHRNPVEGVFKNLPGPHENDLALLLSNFNTYLPPASVAVGAKMQELWLRFANGEGWPETVIVATEDGGVEEVNEEKYEKRFKYGRGKMLREIGWERCFLIAEELQGVRGENGRGGVMRNEG
ncbi:alpha/beta-hydrolase [Delitschia confertaspora ATCC 74209]|uniref:Alpha/beta-hydrolase n=1 Tax=Delitschia confertaspora ATCC 74209 TaxID=1513339 RepID=A0A9P4MR21_9PLEO|nr:alpha/beta-hydrolase [Delitschia confertaspora ATCC 74209]